MAATFPIQTAEQLSTHLRSLRRRLKLTQAELGLRLGVEQARIGKIERNPGSISVDQLLQLLAALETRLRVDGLWGRMIETVERSRDVFYSPQKLLPKGFPENVFNAIGKGIERHTKDFLYGLKHLED